MGGPPDGHAGKQGGGEAAAGRAQGGFDGYAATDVPVHREDAARAGVAPSAV